MFNFSIGYYVPIIHVYTYITLMYTVYLNTYITYIITFIYSVYINTAYTSLLCICSHGSGSYCGKKSCEVD